jgi:hypothetical protein
LTWREAFASLQLEVEEKIGARQRAEVEALNNQQDAAAAGLRAAVGAE